VSRVISHQDFHQFIHGLISDSGPRFRAIVEDSEAYSTSKTTIQRRIALDFDELQQVVKKFEACRIVDDFDRDFVFEVWKGEHADHEDIRAKLSDLQKWESAIGRITGQDAKGLVLVQGRKLAARLSQRVKEEQGHMKEYLLELAELKAKEIQTGLQEIKQTLKAAPGSLASYVEYVSKVQMCKARKDSLADQKKRKLEEMKGVLSKYRSKDEGYPNVPQTSLQSKIEGLGTELQEVAKLVEKAEVDVTEQREQNVEALEEKVVEEQERVRALIEKVGESETLIRADTPAKEALDEAAKIKRKFDESVKRLS
jgi:hypothetical protein